MKVTKSRSKINTERRHGHHLFHWSDHITLLVDGIDTAGKRWESDEKKAVTQWNDIAWKCTPNRGTFSLAPNEKTEAAMFTHMDPTFVFMASIATFSMRIWRNSWLEMSDLWETTGIRAYVSWDQKGVGWGRRGVLYDFLSARRYMLHQDGDQDGKARIGCAYPSSGWSSQ